MFIPAYNAYSWKGFPCRKPYVELAGSISSQVSEEESGEVDIGRTSVPVSTESAFPSLVHFLPQFTRWETFNFFHVTFSSHRNGEFVLSMHTVRPPLLRYGIPIVTAASWNVTVVPEPVTPKMAFSLLPPVPPSILRSGPL